MKHYLTLAVGFLVVLGISSCKKEYYDVVNPNPNSTYVYAIGTNAWQWESGVSHQVFHTKSLPELTEYYLLEGNVSVAISFDGESSYDILPTTFNGIAYSVNYTVGSITIYAEDPLAEPGIEIDLPSPAVVKVVLSESDFIREL
ncbi:hypothetical protein JHJ32_06265 [Parapedobacter sp. ISTM3]|uniref:Uncharacterized protein n=1 Tax=Parapedobacter luteus TaxID=623280 RepID=A0A1T5BDF7_9SPHI|nr:MULTISPECIES: hypothetical protein [Parapedobacter]MBK1439581.1 hypothetical protein [Parapedobacter sp. ISTM3]SKB45185.1 hypothetical protein SAMN05660226_01396 [Parapedobacter luteus]